MILETVYTGVGMGFGVVYLVFQFATISEIKQWRKYIDTALFILLMVMFYRVGSGYMAATTTWAGITISVILRIASAFAGSNEPDASSRGSAFWDGLESKQND